MMQLSSGIENKNTESSSHTPQDHSVDPKMNVVNNKYNTNSVHLDPVPTFSKPTIT